MNMTHYMSLLAENQPWNLIIFMALPVIMAETLTITEFFIIYNKIQRGGLRTLNKIVGIFDVFYFTGIFICLLLNAVIPLTLIPQDITLVIALPNTSQPTIPPITPTIAKLNMISSLIPFLLACHSAKNTAVIIPIAIISP